MFSNTQNTSNFDEFADITDIIFTPTESFIISEDDVNTYDGNLSVFDYNDTTINNNTEGLATVAIDLFKHFNVLSTTIIPEGLDDGPLESIRNISTVPCLDHSIPSVNDYLAAINVIGITIFTLGALSVLFILYMYIDTLKHVMKYSPPLAKTHSAFVLSVYPVVGIATYCAIVVPRAHLLAEAMTQGMFMASLYQLFCLLVAYCGGEAELIRMVKPHSLTLTVPPCCCWPCCRLPSLPVNKKNVRLLRLLVLQLPVVQGLVYMVLLVMWAEEESLYQVNYMYMQPLIILSILCGLWGMIMTLTMLSQVLKDHYIRGKFFVLQLVLVLAKLQGLLARFAIWGNAFPCKVPITPTVYGNLIYNASMLWEMIILGMIARKLYKKPLTDLTSSGKHPEPAHICTVIPCTHQRYIETNNNTDTSVVRF